MGEVHVSIWHRPDHTVSAPLFGDVLHFVLSKPGRFGTGFGCSADFVLSRPRRFGAGFGCSAHFVVQTALFWCWFWLRCPFCIVAPKPRVGGQHHPGLGPKS